MPHAPTPWVGLAALVAMFVIPMLLPSAHLCRLLRPLDQRPRLHDGAA